ncbi:hypothetical protein OG21DRAFT_1479556 [Imleria badia]|nr:hypothetical protein OG21DRAFT_1479556 [Imleria badia]
MKDWRAPIYGFFEPKPLIIEVNGRRAHDFICGAHGCGTTICRYLDKKDAKSTGNLRKHARNCWGVELMKTTDGAKDATKVREALTNTKVLMKMGRPHYYLPLRWTVARDIRLVFARTQKRIATMLKEYNGKMNFTTDAWSSPNHRAFVAFCVHLEHKGKPLSMPLDIVKVASVSHIPLQAADG